MIDIPWGNLEREAGGIWHLGVWMTMSPQDESFQRSRRVYLPVCTAMTMLDRGLAQSGCVVRRITASSGGFMMAPPGAWGSLTGQDQGGGPQRGGVTRLCDRASRFRICSAHYALHTERRYLAQVP